jgi:hypothetical protein
MIAAGCRHGCSCGVVWRSKSCFIMVHISCCLCIFSFACHCNAFPTECGLLLSAMGWPIGCATSRRHLWVEFLLCRSPSLVAGGLALWLPPSLASGCNFPPGCCCPRLWAPFRCPIGRLGADFLSTRAPIFHVPPFSLPFISLQLSALQLSALQLFPLQLSLALQLPLQLSALQLLLKLSLQLPLQLFMLQLSFQLSFQLFEVSVRDALRAPTT